MRWRDCIAFECGHRLLLANHAGPPAGERRKHTHAGQRWRRVQRSLRRGQPGPGGFGANVTITNTGTTAINGWTLQFTFPGNQQITQGWNGVFTQAGANVTVTNASYNATLAGGASVSPGFNGSWSGSNPSPTAFTLNGVSCSVV